MQAFSNNALVNSRVSPLLLCLLGCTAPVAVAPEPKLVLVADYQDSDALPELLRFHLFEVTNEPEFLSAVQEIKKENWRNAAILFQELRTQFSQDSLVSCHWWTLAQSGQAEEALQQGKTHPANQTLAGHFALATAAVAEENFSLAFTHWQSCVAGQARDAELLRAAAFAGHAAGRSAAAARLLDRVAALEPLSVTDQLLRAQALLAADRHEEAFLQYEQLLEKTNQDSELWNQAGLAAFGAASLGGDSGFWRRASRCFLRAQEIDPQDVRYPFNLGCAQDWSGDPSAAELSYRRSLELNPAHVAAGENLALLLREAGRLKESESILRSLLRQPLSKSEVARIQSRLNGER